MNSSCLNPLNVSQVEWELRVKLAQCYHLIDFLAGQRPFLIIFQYAYQEMNTII